MKRIAACLIALCALVWLAGCASTADVVGPKLDAAKKAIKDAKDIGADKLCPDEFQSAEMKLKQAELLQADEETDKAVAAADQSLKLADVAKNCAIAKKAPAPESVGLAGVPDELKNFHTSIYFDFNANAIRPAEREKLDKALAYLTKMAKDHKFYLLLTAYADPPGTTEENMQIARRRALVTRYYLGANGFTVGRIFMKALGEAPAMRGAEGQKPAAANKKDPEWRRVDITVMLELPGKVEDAVTTTE
jgi:outer membrane protein OmpA-like peptidoglycan-associated protein